MKQLFRSLLCTSLLAGLLSIPTLAVEGDVMPISAPVQKQGDFSVVINGEYATFTDAAPKLKDGRSFLPFVAVFEQLGFTQENMTWDAATSTVTAVKPDVNYTPFGGGAQKQGDLTISLAVGSNDFQLKYEGNSTADPHGNQAQVVENYTTDVAPYVDPATNRTYIPFGLVADALGYNVGWDANNGVVIIDDVDAILAANKETYALMDQYLDYSKRYTQGNQKVAGSYSMDMGIDTTMPTGNGAMGFAVDGKYNMLMTGYEAMQFKTDMTMDMSMTENGVDITDTLLGEQAAMFPMTIDMDMRGNLNEGMFYFKSTALSKLMEQPGMENAWFKLDLATLIDEMSATLGMDYAGLMQLVASTQQASFQDTLSLILREMPLVSADMTTSDTLALFNALLADSAFVKTGSTYVNTLDQDGMKMTFTVFTSGSKVTGYTLKMSTQDSTMGQVTIDMSMQNNKMTISMVFDMKLDLGQGSSVSTSMEMKMDGTYQSTSEKAATIPASDAVIIDLTALAGSVTP